ncbi:aryl-sulfate sulfotransferase [Nosocomiicoccus massiliensis]|uniref:aryl-sulfate sulfotransferase n=1 Tax=Nosocomiicoccus massiliensis TaxID=1232430 RepID=UPI00042196B1|nr:aryl-sulfate sulfotransferase [Nosocomiicoccus massiliensis]
MRKIILSMCLILIAGCSAQPDEKPKETSEEKNESIVEEIIDLEEDLYQLEKNKDTLKSIKEIDKEINESYYNDNYTYDNPFIRVDPYGNSPLSAYVMFNTDEPTKVTYTVIGKTEDTSYTYESPNYEVRHQIPIVGLYAGTVNEVLITVTNENGEELEHQIEIETDELDEDFYTVDTVKEKQMKRIDELTYVKAATGELFGVDHAGDIRFVLSNISTEVFEIIEETGHFILNVTHDDTNAIFNELIEIDPVGKIYRAYTYSQSNYDGERPLHNDVITLENGNILLLTHNNVDEHNYDAMIEVDWDNGEIVNSVNFKEVFPEALYKYHVGDDWLHVNNVDVSDDSLIISFLNQNIIAKMSYPENEIEWIITRDDHWPKEDDGLGEKILSAEGVDLPMYPYSIEVLPDQDNNVSTTDILVLDNYESDIDQYSRVIQYRIYQLEDRIEEIDSYREPFYNNGGSVYFEEENNRVFVTSSMSSEENRITSNIVELSHENNDVISEMRIERQKGDNHDSIYHVYRMPLLSENYIVDVLVEPEE